jgi:hypothetical protein
MATKLIDATPEDLKIFKEKMDAVLSELSLGLNLSINKQPVGIKLEDGTIQNGFIDQPTMLIQKKVEVAEEIKSPYDETDKKD